MTALRKVLAAHSIKRERLVSAGLPTDRVDALWADADPTVEEVRTLSRHLHIPVRELLVSLPEGHRGKLKYRSNFGRSVSDEVEYEGALASYRVKAVSTLVPKSKLPHFADYPKTLAAAEELAKMFRENLLGIGPVQPMFGLSRMLFDNFGIVQLLSKFRSLDGVATRSHGAAIVLLAERHVGRMRFTLCHEVCHLLTDLAADDDEVWLDQDVVHEHRGANFKEESFANAFAAACLLPSRGVAKALKEWRAVNESPTNGMTALEIMVVARSFGTSFDVAGSRLEVLGLLPTGGTLSLKRAISEDYSSPEKFAEHFGLPPDPGEHWDEVALLAIKECENKARAGEVSIERIAELFGISLQDVLVTANESRYH